MQLSSRLLDVNANSELIWQEMRSSHCCNKAR